MCKIRIDFKFKRVKTSYCEQKTLKIDCTILCLTAKLYYYTNTQITEGKKIYTTESMAVSYL